MTFPPKTGDHRGITATGAGNPCLDVRTGGGGLDPLPIEDGPPKVKTSFRRFTENSKDFHKNNQKGAKMNATLIDQHNPYGRQGNWLISKLDNPTIDQ